MDIDYKSSLEAIQKLKRINCSLDTSYSEIINIINEEIIIPYFILTIPEGEYLFRGRINNNCSYAHKADISYNLNLDSIKIGRANYYRQSVFYASRNSETAIFELSYIANDVKIGEKETITLGKWYVNKEINVYAIIGDSEQLRKDKKSLEYYNQFVNKFTGHKRQYIIEHLKYFSSEFAKKVDTNQQYEYNISCGIFNHLMFNRDDATIGGILYPSVQWEKNDINIALIPEFVDNNLILESVGEFEIEIFDDKNGAIKQTKICDIRSFK